jgi:Putative heavy-metal-binding/PrsW family intramembrane metalloprotease
MMAQAQQLGADAVINVRFTTSAVTAGAAELYAYVPNPSVILAQLRWTVCALLHSFCSLLAGVGVMRMWKSFQAEKTTPQISYAGTALLSAIILHGSYNSIATMLGTAGFAL